MTIFQLISQEAALERRRMFAVAGLAGIANTLLLASINAAAAAPESVSVRSFFIFCLLIVLYVMCGRHVAHRATALLESALHRIKVRVGEQVARAELEALERVQAAEICDRITENTTFISDRASMIGALLQSALILVFAALYIAWLSLPAFAIVGLLCGVGALMYLDMRQEFITYVRETASTRIGFSESLRDLLSGSKELRLSRRRSRELCQETIALSDALRALSIKLNNIMTKSVLIGEGNLFAVLAAIVFGLHQYVAVDGLAVTSLVAGVMFLWGPFTGVVVGIFPYYRANIVLQQIQALEDKLMTATHQDSPALAAQDPWQGCFTTIEARSLQYTYAADTSGEGFGIGPIDLTITRGEVVFFVGGNGSGKSTLLKVLTGLYLPRAGTLAIDGVPVEPGNVAWYRELISAIFSDFHLFTRLYGLTGVDESLVQHQLARMRLEGKTAFVDGRFTKLSLSTGQRKRLAMIVALLEERPIYVFDEWAADQDPEFRGYFYDEILPLLRHQGKTVLVVSHDDRYFRCADRVVTMEYGNIRSIDTHGPAGEQP